MTPREQSGCLTIALGVIALTLSGCMTVGPDYRAPSIEVPATWQSPYERDVAQTLIDQSRYWEAFGDPVLDDLIQRVGENNRNLRVSLALIAQARAFLGIAGDELLPSFSLGGAATYNRSSENVAPILPPNRDRSDTTFSIGPSAFWELDLFGRVSRSIEAAAASLEADEAEYADLLIVLNAETANAYFEFRALQQRLDFAESNIRLQEETLALTRSRVQAGLVPELDRFQAELNLNRSRALVPLLREGRDNVVNALAVLVGTYPQELAPLLEAPMSNNPLPIVALTTTPADLLRQRPDIRAAERSLAQQTARIGVATADLYPRFSLVGTFTFDAFDASDLFEAESQAFSLGPTFSWRFFEFGRLRDLIRVEEARTEGALATYEQTVLRAVQEVEDALSGLANERQRNASLLLAVQAAEESVQLSRDLYRTGLVVFDTVFETELALLQLQDDLAASNGAVRQNIVRFYRSIGGGFAPPETTE